MDNFDPDAYLATKTDASNGGGFDPDAYLASKDESIGTLAKAAGLATANNLPLAKQAISGMSGAIKSLTGSPDVPGYSESMADITQQAAKAKKASPITYGGFATASALAPAFIPGAEGLAGNAIYGGANAISDIDLSKQPKQALGQAALGAGIGAGTAGLVGKMFPKAANLQKYAEKQAVAATGVDSAKLRGTEEEFQALGKFIDQHHLVGFDKEKMLKMAREQKQNIGETIGEIGKNAKELGLSVDAQTYQKFLADLYSKHLQYSDTANKAAKALARDYKNSAVDILNKSPNGSWDELSKLKEIYGNTAFNDKHEIINQAHADAYFAMKDMLKNISDKAQAMPNVPGNYKVALNDYHQISDVVDGLESMAAKERAGGMPHGGGAHGPVALFKSLPGQSNPAANIATAVAAGTLLHPVAGLATALPTLRNPAFRNVVAHEIKNTLPQTTATTSEALTRYLTEKYGNK